MFDFLSSQFSWVAFLVTIGLLTISPGADTVITIRNTLRGGTGDGLATVLAICSGLFVHATLSGLGIAAIVAADPLLFGYLQWLGAGYLAWLGLGSIRQATGAYHPVNFADQSHHFRLSRSLREGFLSNVLNPKTIAVYLAVLPQFVDPNQAWVQSLVLAGIHFIISVAWLGLFVVGVHVVRGWLIQTRVRKGVDWVVGVSLILLAGTLLLA